MLSVRSLVLIGLASLSLAANVASAQSLFNFPLTLPGSTPPPNPQTFLPPDADPNYSTPGGYDNEVDMTHFTRKEVNDPTGQPAGTGSTKKRQNKQSIFDGG